MALTEDSGPSNMVGVSDPILWVISSNSANIVRVIADVVVDGSFLRSIEIDPDLDDSKFRFDVRETVKPLIGTLFEPIPATLAGAICRSDTIPAQPYGDMDRDVELELFEVTLNGTTGLLDTAHVSGGGGTPDLTSSSTQVIRSFIERTQSSRNVNTIYNLGAGAVDKSILTNAPDNKKIRLGEHEWLGLSQTGAATTRNLTINTYDAQGTLIQTGQSNSSGLTCQSVDIAVGSEEINSLSLASGSQPLITDGVVSYDVAFQGNTNGSIARTFVIDRAGTFVKTRIHFLNKLNRFDSFSFTGGRNKILENEKVGYQKPFDDTYSISDTGQEVLKSSGQNAIEAISEILIEEEKDWLQELIETPKAFEEIDDNGEYIPIIIEGGEFEIRNELKPDPYLRIVFRYAFEREI